MLQNIHGWCSFGRWMKHIVVLKSLRNRVFFFFAFIHTQIGYPCPDTMELTPAGNSMTTSGSAAECRCPPGTAQSPETSRCHKLFEQGPCDVGQYFAPVADIPNRSNIMWVPDKWYQLWMRGEADQIDAFYFYVYRPKKRRGTCKTPSDCLNGMVFWPQDSKCYTLHTRGPCAKGKLITVGANRIAECKVYQLLSLAYWKKNCESNHTFFSIIYSARMKAIWRNSTTETARATNTSPWDHVRTTANCTCPAVDVVAMWNCRTITRTPISATKSVCDHWIRPSG